MINDAKKDCKINIQHHFESEISVFLNDNLCKTAERLCSSVANDWNENDLYDLDMTVLLGFDSSAGHLNPHQKSESQ